MLGPPQVRNAFPSVFCNIQLRESAQGTPDPVHNIVTAVSEVTDEAQAGGAGTLAGLHGVTDGEIIPTVLITEKNSQLRLCTAAKQEGDVGSSAIRHRVKGGNRRVGTSGAAIGAELAGVGSAAAAFPGSDAGTGQNGNRYILLRSVGREAALKQSGKIVIGRALVSICILGRCAGDEDGRLDMGVTPDRSFPFIGLLRLSGSSHEQTDENKDHAGEKGVYNTQNKAEDQQKNTVKTGGIFHKAHSLFAVLKLYQMGTSLSIYFRFVFVFPKDNGPFDDCCGIICEKSENIARILKIMVANFRFVY